MGVRLIALLVRLYLKTVRVSFSSHLEHPSIIALWHKDLPACITAFKNQAIHVQISASRDARLAHILCASLGYKTHQGSSSSKQASIRALLEALSAHHSVGVALDGPRGPAGICKQGALWLNTQHTTPISLVTVHYSKSIRIPSWDRMHFPLPFSSITILVSKLPNPSKDQIDLSYSI